MYCPQCGTLNREGETSCYNCGTSLNDPGDGKEKPISTRSNTAWVLSIVSLGMGILSFFPYPYLASRLYFPVLRHKLYLPGVFDLACLGGLPLGLVSMVLGILAWKRSPKNRTIVTLAIIGILLSIGGMAGHLWFILTCQFCQ